jgi:hypothetical protein
VSQLAAATKDKLMNRSVATYDVEPGTIRLKATAHLMCFALAVVATLLTSQDCAGEDGIDYASQIKPLLAARCYACHGALKQEGGLRLDTGEAIRRGGDSGAAAVVSTPGDSPLLVRVSATDIAERMPPEAEGEPLKAVEIDLLKRWVESGAPSPADEKPEADPREHWAFETVQRPPVPAPRNGPWLNNAVDAFIATEHDRHELSPLPAAKETLLLRRVYLDLIGLPPTRDELQAFAADDAPDAYERVVDQLLARPQYGERWGRHFMDIWRYSDWWGLGAEVRNSQKHIWHWRDWIVESLNADKSYDQMVLEMLAAWTTGTALLQIQPHQLA